MATNTVKLNDKWNMNSAAAINNSLFGNQGGGQHYQIGSRTGSRAQSKGKNKYTLAPIDHSKSLQKVNNSALIPYGAMGGNDIGGGRGGLGMMMGHQPGVIGKFNPIGGDGHINHQNSFQNLMNPQMAPSINSPMIIQQSPYHQQSQKAQGNYNQRTGSSGQYGSGRSGGAGLGIGGSLGGPPAFMSHQMMMMPYQQDPYQAYGQGSGNQILLNMMNPALYGGNQSLVPLRGSLNPREFEMELSGIRAVDEVMIDHTSVLAIKRGDLAIIQGEVFKCSPAAPHLRDIPLVLKRLDCVDRRIYDLKVYELDTFMRFRGHPNIISLFSYWAEKPSSPYQYKSLVCLFEEALLGDMLKTIVLNPVRPSNRLAMKYLCDVCKGLASLNNCNIIHGSVKPSSIYIQSDNTAMIGELGKVELDSARHTHQLFSKVLIQDAMPHTLVYWAPEVLRLERYSTAADMWALGITMYQLVTGEHPFNVTHEESFRDDLFSANVDWSRMAGYPRLRIIVENLLRVDPFKRWDANMVLAYAQEYFVIDIQRVWRGYLQRSEFRRKCKGLVMIQSHIKGFVTKMRYRKDKVFRKEYAARKIQARFRSYQCRKDFLRQKHALMKCQANVLTRQYKRAYQKMRSDVVIAQQYIKRFHAMLWYKRIKESKESLENHIESINEMINKFNVDANQFKGQFASKEIAKPLEYLNNFEQYEMIKAKRGMIEQSHVPKLHQMTNEYERLLEENKRLQENAHKGPSNNLPEFLQDEALKNQLGDKYNELGDMVNALKDNLMRVAQQAKQAQPLQLKMQHPYQYSKWDSIHEPYNIIENVLKDDESVYKALTPSLDFTLAAGALCFISEVVLYPGDCGPQTVEIFVSNTMDKWTFVKQYQCSKNGAQKLVIPGEHVCKYLRVRCVNNVRGGNLVNIRYIIARGLIRN